MHGIAESLNGKRYRFFRMLMNMPKMKMPGEFPNESREGGRVRVME